MLRAADTALSDDFTPSGAISKADARDADEQLNDLAKAHAKHNDVTFEKAYATVVQTSRGRDLYNKSRTAE